MSELISSENTSTYESLNTETTLIINASKCIICDKLLGYQGRFASDFKYHYACLESKQCIFCGCSGINTLCSERPCQSAFHLFCLQRCSRKNLANDLKCPFHPDCKKEKASNYYLTFRKIANSIQMEDIRLSNYKENCGEIKSTYLSHGQIFWSIIGIQYFSYVSKLHQIPVIYRDSYKPPNKNYEKNWVSTTLKTLTKDYKVSKSKNSKTFREFFPAKDAKKTEKVKMTEKELLTADCTSSYIKSKSKDFIQFLEKNIKPTVLDEGDNICEVCQEIDYDDDDLIIKCTKCSIKVHMQCYGISSDEILSDEIPLEEKKWICEQCKSSSEYKFICALCPVTGGVLKPTVNTQSSNFLYFPVPNGTTLWVHIFCAIHIDPNCIKNRIKMENIDLLCIPHKNFAETCQVCNSDKGACVKCLFRKCRVYFHPECGKKFFLYTRDHSGFDVVGPYCELHRTSRLRKTLEIKEEHLYSNFMNFIKQYEKIDKVCVKQTETDFSCEEKFKVFEYVDRYLGEKRGKFELIFKCNRLDKSLRGVVEESLDVCTLLEPKDFLEEGCVIEQHNSAEVKEFYSKNVFEVMKKELKIMKLAPIPYRKKETDLGVS